MPFLRVPTAADDKYSRGVVALRTGSEAYPGAAVLGVEAAWRAGAGFVRYVGEGRAADAVIARRPETVTGTDIGRTRVGAWVIGSGTDAANRTDAERSALLEILQGEAAVVVDAGALDLAGGTAAPTLITPHAGEFARLMDRLQADPSGDRASTVARAAAALDAVVLLKGSETLIAGPDGSVLSVAAGTGWLSTAGTGDVLAGILGSLVAANPHARLAETAAAGAWLHGYAARIAAGVARKGSGHGHPIVAMDVAEALPAAVADLLS